MAGAPTPAGVTNSEIPARPPSPLKRRGVSRWFGDLLKGLFAPAPAPNPYTTAYNNNPYHYNNNPYYYHNRRPYYSNAYYNDYYSRRTLAYGNNNNNPFSFGNGGYYNYYQDRYRYRSPWGLSAFRRRRVLSPWAYAYPPNNPFLVDPAELRA
jgi:hypothetical protein